MKQTLIFLAFAFFGILATAQIPKELVGAEIGIFPKEKIEISINSNCLLVGELLQYRAFILDEFDKNSTLSKIAYVSMRTEMDSVVFSHKLKIENGAAHGDFFLPVALKTGVYRLVGYTNFSRNNTENAWVEKNVYVINPFFKTTETKTGDNILKISAKPIDVTELLNTVNNSHFIQITPNKHSYDFREKVTLKLENSMNNIAGNYLLSVRKVDPIKILETVPKTVQKNSSELFYVPEVRGELISGTVFFKDNGKPAANKEISFTIPGKDFVFKMAKTQSNGKFFFSVAEHYDVEKAIIQLNKSIGDSTDYSIVMDEKELTLGENSSKKLVLEPDIKTWLQERSVQIQVENAYFEIKKDSILNNPINPAFYDGLGTVFVLDDYTRFPSVRETFVEVVTLAAVRGSGENSRLLVNNTYNPNRISKFNDAPPLVLMDGIQIRNNLELLQYDARDIESIRIITEPYRYGPKIFSGIIAVETKDGNFVPKLSDEALIVNLQPVQKKKIHYKAAYGIDSDLARIPDYRTQLLWQPKLLFSEESYFISFYTSDVSGTFEITLEGFSPDGTRIQSKNYFTVSN